MAMGQGKAAESLVVRTDAGKDEKRSCQQDNKQEETAGRS